MNDPMRCLVATALAMLAATGCERDLDGLSPVPPNTDPVVFDDTFGEGVDYQAFLGSRVDAVSIDPEERYVGSASLRVIVPPAGDPSGSYAGGAFTTRGARSFASYDALTFWAKSSVPSTLDVAGLGNDNTGTSRFEASRTGIELTTSWAKYVVPIPLPEKLTDERGLFYFAEGAEDSGGHTIWFDEVRYETVGTVTNPRPVMSSRTVDSFIGARLSVQGTRTAFDVDGETQIIDHQPGYFTFFSSNDTVATVAGGEIEVVGAGTATITAKLDTVEVRGVVTVVVSAPPDIPAPVPTASPADVISLFSNAYTDVPVDTWSATWDAADVADIQIAGDDVKAYTGLRFAGIEFTSQPIDATDMTHFHLDVWVPEGSSLRIKLVDFGQDGTFGGEGADRDSEDELAFTPSTVPALVTGEWVAFDLPLTDFVDLEDTGHLAQLVISGDTDTVYIDNVYFRR
ncbi:MAG: hypothetical protein PVF43_09855 [Candidatus Eiseniibacteriota bacterium]|jgi:hypothetical protein